MVGGMSVLALCARHRGVAISRLPQMSTSMQQRRSIVSKELREPGYKRPAPFPYKQKPYTFWRALIDDTTQRFDENTKIIVVDGPPTGNKDAFARQVAEELDMHYVPGASLDAKYITNYGFDLRTVNDRMPPTMRTWDISQFLQNPRHRDSTCMQYDLFNIRFEQYIEAINHLLNTGQGVVMHRSVYSDVVFMETMADLGFFSDAARKFYYEIREQGMFEFIRPHLLIYLDIPVDQIIKNIKARNRPEEQNSPFYTKEALTMMAKNYKEKYLEPMSKKCELLVYDWSEEGEAEVVVEDICRVNLDNHTKYDAKLQDWLFDNEWEWKAKRIMFSDHKDTMISALRVPKLPVPELTVDGETLRKYYDVLDTLPGNEYAYGFNKSMGDTYIFKTKEDRKP